MMNHVKSHNKLLRSLAYLTRDYPEFSSVDDLEVGTKLNIQQLIEAATLLPQNGKALFVCANATIYQLAALRDKASLIVVSDYSPEAITLLVQWFEGREDVKPWTAYLEYILICEGKPHSAEDVRNLVEKLRVLYRQNKIIIASYDVHDSESLEPKYRSIKFDQVYSIWGIDATTDDEERFWLALGNLLNKLNKNGLLVMTIIRNAKQWDDGNNFFPNIKLTAEKINIEVKKRINAKKVQYLTHLFDENGKREWNYDGYDYLFISLSDNRLIIDGPVPDKLARDKDKWENFPKINL